MCLGRIVPCVWGPLQGVWPMCLRCLKGPLQEVSRVFGDRWPMCLGRSFPCAWSLRPMAGVSWPKFPVCLVAATDGRCALAKVSNVIGRCDRWPMCLGRSFPCAWSLRPMADVHWPKFPVC